MISESYREIEPSDVPSQLIIDLDLRPHDLEIDVNNGNSNFFSTSILRKRYILLFIGYFPEVLEFYSVSYTSVTI